MSTLLKFLLLTAVALAAKILDENRVEVKAEKPHRLYLGKPSRLLPHCWN